MISHNEKFVFVHISKTAGNSISLALGSRSAHPLIRGNNRNGLGQGLQLRYQGANIKHWSLEDYAREWDIVNYYTFSCVRNPWDRMLSLFCFRNGGYSSIAEFREFIAEDRSQATETYLSKLSLGGRLSVNEVLRFESLQEDFRRLCVILGLGPVQLDHVNKGSHGRYRDYYDVETRKLVAGRFREDLEAFGYEY